jgi:hypothetical protein
MESNSNINSTIDSTIEQWKEIAAYHKAQLEKKTQELAAGKLEMKAIVEYHQWEVGYAGRQMADLTHKKLKAKVLTLSTSNNWKVAVEEGRLVRNVQVILEQCYDPLLDLDNHDARARVKERIGEKNSDTWDQFVFSVIENLQKKGKFDEKDGSINTFEDTAGGCDEIAWYAAVEVVTPHHE